MEQGPDFWCWFDTTQFSYHCVHPIHAKMFSIQMLLHFSQIVQRVCTLVLFLFIPATSQASIPNGALTFTVGVIKTTLNGHIYIRLHVYCSVPFLPCNIIFSCFTMFHSVPFCSLNNVTVWCDIYNVHVTYTCTYVHIHVCM